MYGVTFGNKHSMDDWGLILTDVNIGLPTPKRSTISIPGADGELDITGVLTPKIKYKNRPIKLTFQYKSNPEDWGNKSAEIANYLHGQNMHVILDSDPDYYWDAFCVVESTLKNRKATLIVNCDCAPYKLQNIETSKNITGSGTINCINGRKEATPTVITSATATLQLRGTSATVQSGTHEVPELILLEGNNMVTVTSTGTTTIKYREGSL